MMSSQHFLAHGQVKLSCFDNILQIEAHGPWNKEFFYSLHQQLSQAAKQFVNIDFGVLLIPQGEALALPDAVEFHIDFLKSRANTKAIAVLLSQTETPNTTSKMFQQIYSDAGLKHAFFYHKNDAVNWLNQQLTAL